MNIHPMFRIGQFLSAVKRVREKSNGYWKISYGPGTPGMIGVSANINGEQVVDVLTEADVENFLALADDFWQCRDESKNAAGINLQSLQKELLELKEYALTCNEHKTECAPEVIRSHVARALTLVKAIQHHRAHDKANARPEPRTKGKK